MPGVQLPDDQATLRLASATGAGFIHSPVGRAPGGYGAVDYPVHVLLLWGDGVIETVHAFALEWTAEAVHVRVYGRGAQWLPWLPARHVVRCRC